MKLPPLPMRACTLEQYQSLPKLKLWLSLTVPLEETGDLGKSSCACPKVEGQKASHISTFLSRMEMMALCTRGPIPFP